MITGWATRKVVNVDGWRARKVSYPYDSATSAYIAAMTTKPDFLRSVLINDLITGLKADGVWVKLDWLSIFAAHDAQAGRLNVVDPTKVWTVVGSPVFVTDRGYTGATGGYLNSGWDPATNGVQFAQNSASLGAWVRNNVAGSGVTRVVLGNAGSLINPRSATNTLLTRVNQDSTNSTATAPDSTSVGFTASDRPDASNIFPFRNGVKQAGTASTSEALTTDDFLACGHMVTGTPNVDDARQLAAVFWGAHLSDAEHLALYNRLNTYLTAIGAAV